LAANVVIEGQRFVRFNSRQQISMMQNVIPNFRFKTLIQIIFEIFISQTAFYEN